MERYPLQGEMILPSSVYASYVIRPSHLIVLQPGHPPNTALNAVTQRRRVSAEALDDAAVEDKKTLRERIAIQLMARASGRLVPGDLQGSVADPRGAPMTAFTRILADRRKTTLVKLDAECREAHLTTTQEMACKLQASWAGRLV